MTEVKIGVGLDCGTGNLITARIDKKGDITTKCIRDAFFEIKPQNQLVFSTIKKSLLKTGVSFIEDGDKLLLLGDDALTQSVERQALLKRPMARGVISPSEVNALPVFKILLKELLGIPSQKDEPVVYSVPAAPIDDKFDIVYHSTVIKQILTELGYKPIELNEAYALAFSTLDDYDFTGISISFGSGLTNIAMTNMADLVCAFAIAKGGDYIDEASAAALGYSTSNQINEVTPNLVTVVKEAGVDILNPDQSDRIQIAISAHYRHFIKYVISSMVKYFSSNKGMPRFLKPVPVSISGGTSLAKNFKKVFEDELRAVETELPFKISKVLHDPAEALNNVAKGCAIALQNL